MQLDPQWKYKQWPPDLGAIHATESIRLYSIVPGYKNKLYPLVL